MIQNTPNKEERLARRRAARTEADRRVWEAAKFRRRLRLCNTCGAGSGNSSTPYVQCKRCADEINRQRKSDGLPPIEPLLYGKQKSGEKNPRSTITSDNARHIYTQKIRGYTCQEIADQTGCSVSLIKKITSRRTWREATEDLWQAEQRLSNGSGSTNLLQNSGSTPPPSPAGLDSQPTH